VCAYLEKDKKMQTKSDVKELEALRFSAKANRAITTLEMQRKSIVKEYSERIKKIRSVILMIQQREQMGQLAIEGMDEMEISPDLKKLIYNPIGDLN